MPYNLLIVMFAIFIKFSKKGESLWILMRNNKTEYRILGNSTCNILTACVLLWLYADIASYQEHESAFSYNRGKFEGSKEQFLNHIDDNIHYETLKSDSTEIRDYLIKMEQEHDAMQYFIRTDRKENNWLYEYRDWFESEAVAKMKELHKKHFEEIERAKVEAEERDKKERAEKDNIKKRKILNVIRRKGYVTFNGFLQETNLSEDTLRVYIKELMNDRDISKSDRDRLERIYRNRKLELLKIE